MAITRQFALDYLAGQRIILLFEVWTVRFECALAGSKAP
jgi:hypothetical protein